jgi:hypothetical protein
LGFVENHAFNVINKFAAVGFRNLLEKAEGIRTKILDGSAGFQELLELKTLRNSFEASIKSVEKRTDLGVNELKDIAGLKRIIVLLEQTRQIVLDKNWMAFNQAEWQWFEKELLDTAVARETAGSKKDLV